ncbi:cupin domain-containing protein [Niallia oryzisoli]|uniref:Cupin domain-containing protein n=1 Tax=Niallia oryzisoli TaxID=1737571 RepID=A0ABZ2CCA9_9BACI
MDIGSKIRAVRNRKKITIAQMCEGTGLSKGFISNVENNHTSPSINTLQTIANFLEIPLPYLLLEKQQHMHVVKKSERTYSVYHDLKIEHIGYKDGLRMMIIEFPAGASMGTPNAHEGKEIHLVLEGKVEAQQGEDVFILEEGDSFSWNACVPHFVKNVGDGKAVLLVTVYSETDSKDTF